MIELTGRYLRAQDTRHYAVAFGPSQWLLSWLFESPLTLDQAAAGLRLAQMAARWGENLLFDSARNAAMVWALVTYQARILGLDPLDAYLRCLAQPTA
ncbi:hypothetical protein [Nocardia neocaledoniensis]|uniref:hypothetical protein n=1 Tax=Nocardia neocaledoniensis TaxID=236511 RepID=UPI0024585E7F|nr:hypothetical protein [Nocardia neocaledoniensis]